MSYGAPGAVLVSGADATCVRIPFRRPFATAAGTWHERRAWIVRLRDDSGRIGVGEACLEPGAGPSEVAALTAAVRATIPGLAAPGAVDRWLTSSHESTDPVRLALRAAIVSATLDLGLMAWAQLGAPADAVRVNATIATEDPSASVDAARAAVGAGFTCLKLKGGGEPSTETLVERLAAVRAAVGPDVELRLDVNGAWETSTARTRLAALVDLDLAYVEQPIPVGDIPTLVGLRRGSPVRIAADESVASRRAARALLDAGAVDALVVKPARVGGALEAVAIAQEAVAVGVAVTVSSLLETGVGLAGALHVAAALPGDRERAHGLATADLLESDLLATPLMTTFDRIAVPSGPGLGVTLDDEALERWAVERVGVIA